MLDLYLYSVLVKEMFQLLLLHNKSFQNTVISNNNNLYYSLWFLWVKILRRTWLGNSHSGGLCSCSHMVMVRIPGCRSHWGLPGLLLICMCSQAYSIWSHSMTAEGQSGYFHAGAWPLCTRWKLSRFFWPYLRSHTASLQSQSFGYQQATKLNVRELDLTSWWMRCEIL